VKQPELIKLLLSNLGEPGGQAFEWIVFIMSGLFPYFSSFFPRLAPNSEMPSHSQTQVVQLWDALITKTPSMAGDISIPTINFLFEYFVWCLNIERQNNADENLKYMVVALLSILGHITAIGEGEVNEFLVKKGLVQVTVTLLRVQPATPTRLKDLNTTDDTPARGVNSLLMRILANASLHSRQCQDLVREEGGLVLVLNSCIVDRENPWIKEWAILAIRNLTEDNEENQSFVLSLTPQGIPDVVREDFESVGVKLDLPTKS